MKRFYQYSLLALALLIGLHSSVAMAQDVKIIKFNDLEELIGAEDSTVKIVNFWATWCKPCIEEIPVFETISEKYRQKGVDVYLVSMDFASEIERVNRFVLKKGLKSNVLLLDEPDYDSWIDKVSTAWSGSIPSTLLVNGKTGQKVFFEKSFSENELEKEIKKLQ